MGASQTLSTQNQSITRYDLSQLFSTGFKTITVNIAASGSDIELEPGVLIGRIAATGKGAVCKSASDDGSQFPLGICVETKTISDGENADVQIAVTGRVNEDKIVFDGTDDLDTDVDDRTFRDRIPADTEGIELEKYNELTNYENE